jgi:hypothetical protein
MSLGCRWPASETLHNTGLLHCEKPCLHSITVGEREGRGRRVEPDDFDGIPLSRAHAYAGDGT